MSFPVSNRHNTYMSMFIYGGPNTTYVAVGKAEARVAFIAQSAICATASPKAYEFHWKENTSLLSLVRYIPCSVR